MPAQTVIKLRRDTTANWTSTNPTLAAGEPGLETDSGLVKFGDGTTAWNALQYASSASIRTKVLNQTGSPITKGSVVYISGANGDNPTIALADADTDATSSKTLGLVDSTIANGAIGYVIEAGLLTGLNTSTATAGQSVWLSSTAGQFVYGAPPAKPAHSVYLGVVIRAQTNNGAILVKVQNGYELNELHDVDAGSPSTGQVLQWNGTAWVNATVDALPSQTGNAGELLVTDGTTASWSNTVTANSASSIGLAVRAASGQTARLQQWQDSAGSEVAYVSNTGIIGTTTDLIVSGLVGLGLNRTTAQQVLVGSTSSTRIGTTIRGAAAQTANLLELQDSASTVLASVSSAGVVTAPSFVPSSSTVPTNGMYLSAANNVSFSTGSTRRATLSSLGLGVVQNLFIGEGVGSSAAFIEVGSGRTADGNAYIDLISDTTYTDYGARFIRATGENGPLIIVNRGTGGIIIEATEAGYIALQTTDITRMRIAATGEVGIGASPITTDMLYVNTVSAANTGLLIRGVASQTGNLQEWQNSSGTILASVDSSGRFVGDGSQLTGIAAGESISSLLLMGA